ncbi:hypothetical protein FRC08_012465 [Ceratobasidium sp. 394]|nr:hypothetical protein FRC08_012465 [Ceratobasidium sp. 394]
MLYSVVTMFRRRGWFGALCFVLAATLPTCVLGSQVLLSLSSLPAVGALSTLSPYSVHHSPPPTHSTSFHPIRITDLMRKLTVWSSNTEQMVSDLFSKPRTMFSRLGSCIYRAVSLPPPRPSPSPPATRTLGGSPPSTRTRTTSTDRPALPEPAYARLGRSYTSRRLSGSSRHIRKPYGSRSSFPSRLARHLRALYSFFVDAVRLPAALAEAFLLLGTPSQIIRTFGLLEFTLLFIIQWRRVHYRYTLTIEGYQFSSRRILTRKRLWTPDCPYSYRESMDWKTWHAIDGYIQYIRMKKARIWDFSLKVRVIRERTVRDWYFTIFGMRSVEVPEDPYHGTDVFENEDDLVLTIPDLDHDLELPTRPRGELWRDWLLGEPPTPPSSAPPTPSPPQRAFVQPVRIADPGDPPDAGEDEGILWH